MMQHDDFFDLVSQRVHVYRGDIVGTTSDSIVLEGGEGVRTDVVFAGTGWDATCSFLSTQQMCELGLPHDRRDGDAEEEQAWTTLLDEADDRVVKEFPIFTDTPLGMKPRPVTDTTPARLYQGIAPIDDPTIVFLGRTKLPNGFFNAEAQAVWTTAYWDGHVRLPPTEETRSKIAYMAAFSRRRYPSDGGDGLNFFRDMIWYVDGLLSEAGLGGHRKSWWEDADEPHVISDLRDCKDEYLAKYQSHSIAPIV
jgi:dimethylaniline monooxygenase (N-oxide forming)